jgi:sugar lactone lactonase YvrE
MYPSKFRRGAGVCLAAILCAGSALAANQKLPKTALVVPDQGNNRVLIYNVPSENGQRADILLGQSSYSSATSGTTDSTMNGPSAFAFDENGNLYIGDRANCRVLQFRPPFTDGKAASAVIGKPDFTTGCGGTVSASNLAQTEGLTFDGDGNLWVSDYGNNRVLRFKAPIKTGKAADIVLGQPDFVTTGICPTTPSAGTLCQPQGIAVDSDEILWVADSSNNRVLGYKSPKKKMNATYELGHPPATAFTSSTANDGGLSARSFWGPDGIGFDSKDHMWVADSGNNRVLMFKPDFRNGIAASLVLGQPDFVTNPATAPAPTASNFASPQGIEVLRSGNVWVGDTNDSRTLQFVSPFTNGMNASLVLGQEDFTSNQANHGSMDPDDQTQNYPFNAGPSLIALAVLGGLAGGRQWWLRMRKG